jgi:transposase-like protein
MHGTLGGTGAVRRQKRYDDAELLRRLYLHEGMTIAEIARDLGATSVTIQKYLKKHEIPSRGRGPRRGRRLLRQLGDPESRQISEALRASLLQLVRAAADSDGADRDRLLDQLTEAISSA